MLSMNKLPTEKRIQILSMLCEGSSMRSISRVADVSINTVSKLLVDAGKACAAFHDEKVRDVKARDARREERFIYIVALTLLLDIILFTFLPSVSGPVGNPDPSTSHSYPARQQDGSAGDSPDAGPRIGAIVREAVSQNSN